MTTGAVTTADWLALETGLAGQLILPTSEDYDAARATANARFDDVRPAAIVRCATPADVLLALQTFMEEPTMGTDAEGAERPRFVSQIFIRAAPEQVWRAITESEFTLQYYYGSTVESDWQAGSTFRYAISGNDAIVGTVLEADAPRRLVMTFDARWDDDVAADAPSRLTWELEEAAPGVTKVTTIHDEFPSQTATYHQVSGGMPYILSGLKSLIETGEPLAPRVAAATA